MRLTFSPKPVATSSPRASEFMPRADARQTKAPAARTGATAPMLSHEAPPTPPICQERKVSMTLARGRTIALTSEAKAAELAAPASASLSGVAPPRPRDPTV